MDYIGYRYRCILQLFVSEDGRESIEEDEEGDSISQRNAEERHQEEYEIRRNPEAESVEGFEGEEEQEVSVSDREVEENDSIGQEKMEENLSAVERESIPDDHHLPNDTAEDVDDKSEKMDTPEPEESVDSELKSTQDEPEPEEITPPMFLDESIPPVLAVVGKSSAPPLDLAKKEKEQKQPNRSRPSRQAQRQSQRQPKYRPPPTRSNVAGASRRPKSHSPSAERRDLSASPQKMKVDIHSIFRSSDRKREVQHQRTEALQKKQTEEEERKKAAEEDKRREAEGAFQSWLSRKREEKRKARSVSRNLVRNKPNMRVKRA